MVPENHQQVDLFIWCHSYHYTTFYFKIPVSESYLQVELGMKLELNVSFREQYIK